MTNLCPVSAPAEVRVFNEIDHLNECALLLALLTHYADLAAPDRHIWHARKMPADGADARELTRLHGELIAYGWLEINLDEVTACYRATTAGLRARRHADEPRTE
jgi:hypothetical protein